MLLQAWARDGYKDADIARKIGITAPTLWEWKQKHEEIANALKRGKEPVDVEVENKLLESAKGFYVTVREPMKLKRVKQKQGEGRIEEEYVEYVDRQIYVPPSQTAQIFWLKNRKPNQWREKREVVADVADNAFRNMQTIASLINHPEPDIDIEDASNPAGGSEGE